MVVANQTIDIYRGNRRILEFTIRQEPDSQTARDITNDRVQFAVARIGTNGPIVTNPLIDLNSNTSPTKVNKVDAAAGRVNVVLESTETAIQVGSYYFELEVVDLSGQSAVVATGTFNVLVNINNA